MKESSYGSFTQTALKDHVSSYVEEISIKGFTTIPNLFSDDELSLWRQKIDKVYEKQEKEYGRECLISIQELDVCRAPLLYDFSFIELATHPLVIGIVERILGDWFILNLQNAIINRPNSIHHQSSWHRDLPYQNYTISRPLAINALVAIDEFSSKTGGTQLVPFTHKTEVLPSDNYIENNKITANVPSGSVIVFDSMLFHKAGENTSGIVRRAVNHLFTTPMIKQQYDFSRALSNQQNHLNSFQERLLGFSSQVYVNDKEWRNARKRKLSRESDIS